MPINLIIPFLPPPLNRMYTHSRNNPHAKILTPEAREFQRKFDALLREDGRIIQLQTDLQALLADVQRTLADTPNPPLVGGLFLRVTVYKTNAFKKDGTPNLRGGDTDGYVKILKDSLFKALGADDGWVINEVVEKKHGESNGIHVCLDCIGRLR